MTKQNFQEAIDRLLAQNPFRPFTVEMTNGSRYEVDHDRAMATRDGTALYVMPGGTPVWFDYQNVTAIVGDLASTSRGRRRRNVD